MPKQQSINPPSAMALQARVGLRSSNRSVPAGQTAVLGAFARRERGNTPSSLARHSNSVIARIYIDPLNNISPICNGNGTHLDRP